MSNTLTNGALPTGTLPTDAYGAPAFPLAPTDEQTAGYQGPTPYPGSDLIGGSTAVEAHRRSYSPVLAVCGVLVTMTAIWALFGGTLPSTVIVGGVLTVVALVGVAVLLSAVFGHRRAENA